MTSYFISLFFFFANRSLFQQILDIEKQINDTYEYFSGEPIEHLPYETEEGRLMYEELQKIEQERLDKENQRGAIETKGGDNMEEDEEDSDEDTEDDSDEGDGSDEEDKEEEDA